MLSHEDYSHMSLTDRLVQTTDYTRISEANYSTSNNNLFNGYYWTRSPIETIEEMTHQCLDVI